MSINLVDFTKVGIFSDLQIISEKKNQKTLSLINICRDLLD